MKRLITSIFISTVIGIAAWSQPKLTSNVQTHNMGQVQWKNPVTIEYTITNTGDAPLVMSHITTSCACAVAEWTQTPIAPGDKGMVRATFDAKALGHFHKSVGIYSNASPNLMYLYFIGEVVREVTDYSNQLPHSIGNILLDRVDLEFPDAHLGEKPQISITIANQSDQPYEPVLMHLPSYMDIVKEPSVLQKGEKGRMTVTLDTDRLAELGLTQASVYLSRFAGDKVGDENEIPVSIVLLPDMNDMKFGQRNNPPKIHLSETSVDLREKLKKKDKVTHDITVTNKGKSPLEISKLQLFDPAIGAELKKDIIKPGDKTRLRITVDKDKLHKKKRPRILMITNDPEQPKVIIDIVVKSSNSK